jgi:hypothetical protein
VVRVLRRHRRGVRGQSGRRQLFQGDQIGPYLRQLADRAGRVGVLVADVVLHGGEVVGGVAVRNEVAAEEAEPGGERQQRGQGGDP